MSFKRYTDTAPKSGATIRHVLRSLPAAPGRGQPAVQLEHLGKTNQSYMAAIVAEAGTKKVQDNRLTLKVMEEDDRKKREIVAAHAVRHLEDVVHDDGTDATDAEIASFVASLPQCDVDEMFFAASNVANYRPDPSALVKDTAGKS